MQYTLEIRTIGGIADPGYLDRLAEIVYDVPDVIDPLLGLNDDGSVSASFCVVGSDPLAAAHDAVAAFVRACAAAGPLREGALGAADTATVERFAVERVDDREHVLA